MFIHVILAICSQFLICWTSVSSLTMPHWISVVYFPCLPAISTTSNTSLLTHFPKLAVVDTEICVRGKSTAGCILPIFSICLIKNTRFSHPNQLEIHGDPWITRTNLLSLDSSRIDISVFCSSLNKGCTGFNAKEQFWIVRVSLNLKDILPTFKCPESPVSSDPGRILGLGGGMRSQEGHVNNANKLKTSHKHNAHTVCLLLGDSVW